MKSIIERENNLDLLRIIATFAVIMIHLGVNFFDIYSSDVGRFYSIIFRFGVPLFLMLSGAFAFRKRVEPISFYKKAMKKLGIPLIIVSIMYILLNCIQQYYIVGLNISILNEPLIALLKGEPFYHLWYMFMLIGLYGIIPLLQIIKEKLSKNFFDILIYGMVVWGFLSLWTIEFKVHWNGEFLAYIGYFLLGYKIKNELNNKNPFKYFVLGGIFLIINYMLYIILGKYINEDLLIKLVVHRLSLCNIIASICIFIGFCNLKINRNIFSLAEKTYLIYLFHALYIIIVLKFLKVYGYTESSLLDIFIIPLLACVIYVLSHITSILYEKCEEFFRNNN